MQCKEGNFAYCLFSIADYLCPIELPNPDECPSTSLRINLQQQPQSSNAAGYRKQLSGFLTVLA